jgi:hypothetical protein
MVTARFIVQGKEHESRDVDEQWLENACANQDNVLLRDGNTYRIRQVTYVGAGLERYACVELVAPQFARAS